MCVIFVVNDSTEQMHCGSVENSRDGIAAICCCSQVDFDVSKRCVALNKSQHHN